MTTLGDRDRARLARILGMLGSDHAGERAAAGLKAEEFRKKHGLTWAQMLALPPLKPEPPPRDAAKEAAEAKARAEAEAQRAAKARAEAEAKARETAEAAARKAAREAEAAAAREAQHAAYRAAARERIREADERRARAAPPPPEPEPAPLKSKPAPPWPYPMPPPRPMVSTIEEWRATFAPETKDTESRWLAVMYFGACALVLVGLFVGYHG